jgi:predicted CopG family antitoxin
MRFLKYIVLTLLVCVAMGAEAKTVKARHMYVFGFAASFKDSVVYMTEIQDVQGALYDTKTKFLLGRDSYSDQLKTYFKEKKQMSDRVCMVMFSTSKKKAEKKYLKLRKKYVGDKKRPSTYEVRYVTIQDFEFEPVGLDE